MKKENVKVEERPKGRRGSPKVGSNDYTLKTIMVFIKGTMQNTLRISQQKTKELSVCFSTIHWIQK